MSKYAQTQRRFTAAPVSSASLYPAPVLTVEAGDGEVSLSWELEYPAPQYWVWQRRKNGGAWGWENVGDGNQYGATDIDVSPGGEDYFEYRVWGRTDSVDGEISNVAGLYGEEPE